MAPEDHEATRAMPGEGDLPTAAGEHGLPPAAVERAMRTSIYEGIAFALMVGLGEVYFLADAIRVSASRLEQGLIVTVPLFLGSLGPLLALRALSRMRSRKPLVVGAALGQASALLVLALTAALGRTTPMTLLGCVCAYQLFGQAVGTAWSSWFADLVPSGRRGRYFALRNRGIYLFASVGLLGGGFLLHWLEPASPAQALGAASRGFAWTYALAAFARLISLSLHLRCPEGPFSRPARRTHLAGFLRSPEGVTVGRLLVVCPALYLVVYLASPYFTPYMLQTLNFSYLQFMVASLFIVVMKVLFAPAWGAMIEQAGARSVFLLCAVLLSIVPLPWLFASGLGFVLLAQGLSGLSWAGFEVSVFCMLVENTPRAVRPFVFAAQAALNGTAQLFGGLGGALLAATVASDLRVLFAISLLGRLLLAIGLPRLVPAPPGDQGTGRGEVLLRVIGIRPSGGLAVRPITPRD